MLTQTLIYLSLTMENLNNDNLLKEISKYTYCYSGSGMLTNDVDEETQLKNAKKILKLVENSLNKEHIRLRRENNQCRIETGRTAGQIVPLTDDTFVAGHIQQYNH